MIITIVIITVRIWFKVLTQNGRNGEVRRVKQNVCGKLNSVILQFAGFHS